MKKVTNISIDERKLNIILAWIYGDFKPDKYHEVDKKIISQLKNACERLGCIDVYESWINLEEDKFDKFEREEREEMKKKIFNPNGKFSCPKCNVRTNEKTPQTSCVICNTSLNRELVVGRDN